LSRLILAFDCTKDGGQSHKFLGMSHGRKLGISHRLPIAIITQLLWLFLTALATLCAFAFGISLVRSIFITWKPTETLSEYTLIARILPTTICLKQSRNATILFGHSGSDSLFVLGYLQFNTMRFVYPMHHTVFLYCCILQIRSYICLVQFKLFYNPENEVVIENNWKDRFPQNYPVGEWSYSPSTRDLTPYLYDSVLSHYVRNPTHAPPGDYLWTRIPKRVRDQISYHNDPERTGWSLVMNEEWHQTAFLVFWGPILAIGAVGSGLYTYYAEKPAATGFTVFGGLLALTVWFYQLAQGYAKQGGLL